jgi:tetratricopeptide (TPR) repeat protein
VLALRDIGGGLSASDYASAADAMEQISRGADRIRIASARVQYAWFQLRNSDESAIADLEASLPVVLQDDPLDVIRAEWALGWALLHAGQWGRMQSVATAAAAHAQKNGSPRIEALFKVQLAWLHVECGAYQSAQTFCRRAVELSGNPTHGVGVVMCQVIMAMAAIGLNDPVAALDYARHALNIDMPSETFWRSIAEICALQARLMKHSVPTIRESVVRLSNLAANLRENTWKAIAFAWCAQGAEVTGQEKLAHQYSDLALQLVQGAKLPLAKSRVEAVAADILDNSRAGAAGGESVQLRDKSKKSRQKLFKSLGIQDPLRNFCKLHLE